MQNGGFLGLLASLGIPLIYSLIASLRGNWLQIDRSRRGNGLQICSRASGAGLQRDSAPRTYKRIPTIDLKKPTFLDYSISNFDIYEMG